MISTFNQHATKQMLGKCGFHPSEEVRGDFRTYSIQVDKVMLLESTSGHMRTTGRVGLKASLLWTRW